MDADLIKDLVELIPSAFCVDESLLEPNLNTKPPEKLYIINECVFAEAPEHGDAERVEFKVRKEGDEAILEEDSDTFQEEHAASNNDFTITKEPDGVLINSKVYISDPKWNTLVSVGGLFQCAVCDMVVTTDIIHDHMSSTSHEDNMARCTPLSQYELNIVRKIDNYYHCGICNAISEDISAHIKLKTHEENYLYATNTGRDIVIETELVRRGNQYNAKDVNENMYVDREIPLNLNGPVLRQPTSKDNKELNVETNEPTNKQANANEFPALNVSNRFNVPQNPSNVFNAPNKAPIQTPYPHSTPPSNYAHANNFNPHFPNLNGPISSHMYLNNSPLGFMFGHCYGMWPAEIRNGAPVPNLNCASYASVCAAPHLGCNVIGPVVNINTACSIPNVPVQNFNTDRSVIKPVQKLKRSKKNRRKATLTYSEVHTVSPSNSGDSSTYASVVKKSIAPEYVVKQFGDREVKILFDSWNMITCKQNRWFCTACNKTVNNKFSHSCSAKHLASLEKCEIFQVYEDNLIRKVHNKLMHCGRCNSTHSPHDMACHVASVHQETPSKENPKEEEKKNENNDKRNTNDTQTSRALSTICAREMLPQPMAAEIPMSVYNSEIKICPFEVELTINLLRYNAVFIHRGQVVCCLCNCALPVDVVHHICSVHHTEMLRMTPFIQQFGNQLIREIRGQLHCALCNVHIMHDAIFTHIMTPPHTNAFARATNGPTGPIAYPNAPACCQGMAPVPTHRYPWRPTPQPFGHIPPSFAHQPLLSPGIVHPFAAVTFAGHHSFSPLYSPIGQQYYNGPRMPAPNVPYVPWADARDPGPFDDPRIVEVVEFKPKNPNVETSHDDKSPNGTGQGQNVDENVTSELETCAENAEEKSSAVHDANDAEIDTKEPINNSKKEIELTLTKISETSRESNGTVKIFDVDSSKEKIPLRILKRTETNVHKNTLTETPQKAPATTVKEPTNTASPAATSNSNTSKTERDAKNWWKVKVVKDVAPSVPAVNKNTTGSDVASKEIEATSGKISTGEVVTETKPLNTSTAPPAGIKINTNLDNNGQDFLKSPNNGVAEPTESLVLTTSTNTDTVKSDSVTSKKKDGIAETTNSATFQSVDITSEKNNQNVQTKCAEKIDQSDMDLNAMSTQDKITQPDDSNVDESLASLLSTVLIITPKNEQINSVKDEKINVMCEKDRTANVSDAKVPTDDIKQIKPHDVHETALESVKSPKIDLNKSSISAKCNNYESNFQNRVDKSVCVFTSNTTTSEIQKNVSVEILKTVSEKDDKSKVISTDSSTAVLKQIQPLNTQTYSNKYWAETNLTVKLPEERSKNDTMTIKSTEPLPQTAPSENVKNPENINNISKDSDKKIISVARDCYPPLPQTGGDGSFLLKNIPKVVKPLHVNDKATKTMSRNEKLQKKKERPKKADAGVIKAKKENNVIKTSVINEIKRNVDLVSDEFKSIGAGRKSEYPDFEETLRVNVVFRNSALVARSKNRVKENKLFSEVAKTCKPPPPFIPKPLETVTKLPVDKTKTAWAKSRLMKVVPHKSASNLVVTGVVLNNTVANDLCKEERMPVNVYTKLSEEASELNTHNNSAIKEEVQSSAGTINDLYFQNNVPTNETESNKIISIDNLFKYYDKIATVKATTESNTITPEDIRQVSELYEPVVETKTAVSDKETIKKEAKIDKKNVMSDSKDNIDKNKNHSDEKKPVLEQNTSKLKENTNTKLKQAELDNKTVTDGKGKVNEMKKDCSEKKPSFEQTASKTKEPELDKTKKTILGEKEKADKKKENLPKQSLGDNSAGGSNNAAPGGDKQAKEQSMNRRIIEEPKKPSIDKPSQQKPNTNVNVKAKVKIPVIEQDLLNFDRNVNFIYQKDFSKPKTKHTKIIAEPMRSKKNEMKKGSKGAKKRANAKNKGFKTEPATFDKSKVSEMSKKCKELTKSSTTVDEKETAASKTDAKRCVELTSKVSDANKLNPATEGARSNTSNADDSASEKVRATLNNTPDEAASLSIDYGVTDHSEMKNVSTSIDPCQVNELATPPSVPYNLEETIYLKIKDTYVKVSFNSYNTLTSLNDGVRFCFVCWISMFKTECKTHVESEIHYENLKSIKYVDQYTDHMIRCKNSTYHCTACNVIITGNIVGHLSWQPHEAALLRTARTSRQVSKDLKKNKHRQFTAEITNKPLAEHLPIKFTYVVRNLLA